MTDHPADPGTGVSRGVLLARAALRAAGVAMGLWGLWLLFDVLEPAALIRLPLWLGGAVVTDDFILTPLTIGIGWLVTRWSMGPGRHRTIGAVRTTLLYVGVTTLIAIPLLLRQGKGVNPTVLPRDYLRDWLLLEATIIVVGAVVFVLQRSPLSFKRFRMLRRSRASSGDMGGR